MHDSVDQLDRIRRNWNASRFPLRAASSDVEATGMEGALDFPILDVSIGKRAIAMGTRIINCIQAVIQLKQGDATPVDEEELSLVVLQVFDRTEGVQTLLVAFGIHHWRHYSDRRNE